MVKGIIFDLGGVLIDLDLDTCRKNFKSILSYHKIDEILDASHHRGFYADFESGLISEEEFKLNILKDSREGGSAEEVDRCMYSLLKGMDPYKAELLKSLSCKYSIYLLSNNNVIALRRTREIFENNGLVFDETFKKLYISCEMKNIKPSADIYNEMIDDLGGTPSDYLFIDDSMLNVEAAKSVGINAVHYTPGEDLKALINNELGGLEC